MSSFAQNKDFYSISAKKLNVDAIKYDNLDKVFANYFVVDINVIDIYNYIKKSKGISHINLKIGNEYDWEINIEPCDPRSDNYVLRVRTQDGITTYPKTTADTYKGYLNSNPDKEVRLTIKENYISGFVEQKGEAIFIEPISRFDSKASSNHFVVYNSKDLLSHLPFKCEATKADDINSKIKKKIDKSTKAASGCVETEIAIVADSFMVAKFGSVSAVANEVIELLNLVNGLYSPSPLEIEYELVELYVSTVSNDITADSLVSVNPILSDFTSWDNGGGFTNTHDVATFWSGRDYVDGGGKAWLDQICTIYAQNIVSHYTNSSQGFLKVLWAHELGHNWSAEHGPSSGYIMNASSLDPNAVWHQTSIDSILTYKAALTCLDSCGTTTLSIAYMGNKNASCKDSCNGSAMVVALGGTPPYSYQWNDVNSQTSAIASGLCAGMYNVTVTDSLGDTSNAAFTINEPSALILTATANDASQDNCDGSSTASVSGGTSSYSYQWDDTLAQTTSTADSLCAGTYNVTVTDANGCIKTTSIIVNETTGISKNDFNKKVKIYPNPSKGIVSIDIQNQGEEVLVEVTNLFGRAIYNKRVKKSIEQIDLSDYPPGIYFVVVQGENMMQLGKIVKY